MLTTIFWVLALAGLAYSLHMHRYSNGNFGTFLVDCCTALAFVLALWWRPLWAFAHTGVGRVLAAVLALGLGVFLVLLGFVAVSGYSNQPKGDEKAVVVLGAAVHGTKVSRLLQYRLDAAYDWAAEHPEAIVVTTGGQGRGEDVPEGRAMRDYLLAKGLAPERVFAEEASTSTEENFLFSQPILEAQGVSTEDPIVLVTNAFHCYRATRYGEAAGYARVRALPAAISWSALLPCYFREVFALLYYWVFRSSQSGWISGFVGLLAPLMKYEHL